MWIIDRFYCPGHTGVEEMHSLLISRRELRKVFLISSRIFYLWIMHKSLQNYKLGFMRNPHNPRTLCLVLLQLQLEQNMRKMHSWLRTLRKILRSEKTWSLQWSNMPGHRQNWKFMCIVQERLCSGGRKVLSSHWGG